MTDIFPESREEEILVSTINGEEYDKAPESRIEALLLELKEVIEEGGGGGGTTNYNLLSNKPSINSVTLTGDKSSSDLGIPTDADLAGKQDVLPVTASGNDVAFNGDIQDGQGNTLSVLAEALTKIASGNPIVITDCAGGKARSLKTTINAIQDLHGYDKPWAGGAGKNKYPILISADSFSNQGGGTHSGSDGVLTVNVSAVDDGVYSQTTSELNKAFDNMPIGNVTYSFYMKASVAGNVAIGYLGKGNTWINATTSWVRYNITYNKAESGTANFIIYNKVAGARTIEIKDFMIEVGNSMSAYEPYSNICPISGRDSVAVEDTGRNIWDEVWEVGAINDTTGEIVSGNRISSSHYIKVSQGVEYYITFPDRLTDDIKLYYYDKDYHYLGTSTWLRRGTVTFADNVAYFRFNMATAYGLTYNHDICINISDASFNGQYVPYAHSSATIQLGQTVYGADINWDTGVMTITDVTIIKNGTETWAIDSQRLAQYGAAFPSDALPKLPPTNGTKAELICNQYKTRSANDTYSKIQGISIQAVQGYLYIYDSRFTTETDLTAWASWLSSNPLQICYKLATPTTIQLTPEQLELLKGYNRVTIDNGSIELGYIAKAISGNDEEIAPLVGDKATKSYAVNDFIERADGLYRVTAPIASGASFTANNTVKMSIGEALTYLYNK